MRAIIASLCLALLSAGGCTSYHRVIDPATGKVYYTKDLDHERGGAVRLRDAATGDRVTLQNSQVSEVSKEEFETNRSGRH